MVCVPHLSHTHTHTHTCSCIAFPLLQISHLCAFCDILSPKAVYVSCPFFRPKMFSPGDCVWCHSCTLGAHVLATVVGPSPNGPQFCHIQYIHPGGSLKRIMRELNSQGSRLWSLHHPRLHSCRTLPPLLFASVEGTTVSLATSTPPTWGGETVTRYGGRFHGVGGGRVVFMPPPYSPADVECCDA